MGPDVPFEQFEQVMEKAKLISERWSETAQIRIDSDDEPVPDEPE